MLRPYVFAAHRYELYYAPWTLPGLPIAEPVNRVEGLTPGPFIADLVPKSRVATIKLYGRTVLISPPILSHAAILRFFSKRSTSKDSVAQLPTPFTTVYGSRIELNPFEGILMMNREGEDDGDDDEEMEEEVEVLRDSRQHDQDFQRLLTCYDPSICRGMKRSVWAGHWNGCWEGNFSFFDFDAFKDMLAGKSAALYNGSYGEQAQVWRLQETFIRPQTRNGKERARGLPLKITGMKSRPVQALD